MLRLVLARLRARGRLTVPGRPRLGRGVRFDLGPGAVRWATVVASATTAASTSAPAPRSRSAPTRAWASVRLRGPRAHRDRGGARLGDEVVLIDFDHDVGDVERPAREQALVTAPVVIGERAVVGTAAGVLRGVTVGAARAWACARW